MVSVANDCWAWVCTPYRSNAAAWLIVSVKTSRSLNSSSLVAQLAPGGKRSTRTPVFPCSTNGAPVRTPTDGQPRAVSPAARVAHGHRRQGRRTRGNGELRHKVRRVYIGRSESGCGAGRVRLSIQATADDCHSWRRLGDRICLEAVRRAKGRSGEATLPSRICCLDRGSWRSGRDTIRCDKTWLGN